MTTLFSRIIDGELPGVFVWSDPLCMAFLSISPATRGHTLVVPRSEIDHWVDAPVDLMDHLMHVAREVGRAQLAAFECERIGLVIQGFEVPHLHVHVLPTASAADFQHLGGESVPAEELQQVGRELRAALAEAGHASAVEAALLATAR